jgi:sugar/nucleoside kinase (ribokinase family)
VERIAWSTSLWVDEMEHAIGGNGASTSYTSARLGVSTRLLSVVGADRIGGELLETLRAAGVDTTFVQRLEAPTPATVALVNVQGDRMLLHRPGLAATAFQNAPELTPAALDGMGHFHLANPFAMSNLRRHGPDLLRLARAAGLSTSVDTGWDSHGRWMADLGPCLPHTGLLFGNAAELKMVTGSGEPEVAAARLRDRGVRTVVIKLGDQGAAVYGDEDEFRAPAFDVAAVDTTGAGDVFVGAFLAALQRGCSLRDAARTANAAAGLTVQGLGATAGLAGWEELARWAAATPARA